MKSRKATIGIAATVGFGLFVLVPSCAGYSTCQDRGYCPGEPWGFGGGSGSGGASAGTDSGGHSGDGAIAGGSSGTGGSGTAGHAGSVGGGNDSGGASGAAGSPPCNDECTGLTPVCDPASNECVQCLVGNDCEAPTPACDATTNTCVECTNSTDCKDATKPFCDASAQKCVACLKQADCTSPAASACNAGVCTACTTDAECSNINGKGVCDAGTCVQCTGNKFVACGQNGGTPLVCDSLLRTCTINKQHSAGLCQQCTSDAHCGSGQMCVLDKYGSPAKDVGYFCHWKQGDTGNGAPADCTVSAQPYFGVLKNAVSIDGVVNDICTLRKSTCVARGQFSSKNCTVSSAPSDAACGFSPGIDSKCVQVDSSSTFLCTMTCIGNPDCPGTTCDTGASTPVCLLQ